MAHQVPFAARIGEGLRVVWHGPEGAAFASFAHAGSLEAERRHYLGTGEGGEDQVDLAVFGEDSVVAYAEARGAYAERLGNAARVLVHLPEGRHPCAAAIGGRVYLAAATPLGIELTSNTFGEPFLWSRRRGVRAMHLVRAGANLLALCATSEGLLSLRFDTMRGETNEVLHRVRANIELLACCGMGARTAVALAYDDGRIERAVFDARGASIERPHACLSIEGPSDGLSVFWRRTDFVVAVRDVKKQRLRFTGELEAIDGMDYAPSVHAHAGRILALGCVDGELRLTVREGTLLSRLPPRKLEPPDAEQRRFLLAARKLLRETQRSLGGAYRSAHRYDADGLVGVLRSETRAAEIEIEGSVRGGRVELRSYEPDVSLPPPASPLVRLAEWVRGRFSEESLARHESDRAWARALVGIELEDDEQLKVSRAGPSVSIAFPVVTLPTPTTIARWLRALLRDG